MAIERYADIAAIPAASSAGACECAVTLLVDGWPDDVRTCVEALLTHTALPITALALGDVDGVGELLDGFASAAPDRVRAIHVPQTLDEVGWGPARAALLRAEGARLHVVMDNSSVLDGDAITPLAAAIDNYDAVAAGWRGVHVDTTDWYSFVDAPPGEVDAVLGYLFVTRRDAALDAPPHAKAKFYRNADMEWCLGLRAAGGRIVAPVPAEQLPVHQERHRGYHDSDPATRDEMSRENYMRLLKRFKGKTQILAPRAS